jgi:hypothetical protein
VRPLVSDRIVQPFRTSWDYSPAHEMQQLYGDSITSGGKTLITGHFWGQVNGIRAGGKISGGIPGADAAFVDAQDSLWWEPGFTVPANGLYYLWLLFPFGLPRWVRSVRTPVGGLRFPQGVRGIPCVSATGPDGQSHVPSSATIDIPASTGLDPATASPTGDAVCAVAAVASALDTPDRFVAGGDWVELNSGSLPPVISPPSNGTGNAFDRYNLTVGTHFPRNARAVRCVFEAEFTGVAANNLELDARIGVCHSTSSARTTDVKVVRSTHQFSATGTNIISITADIQRIPEASIGAGMTVRIDWGATGHTGKSNEECEIVGWRQMG